MNIIRLRHDRELDKDGDGHISVTEFTAGFKGIRDTLLGLTRCKENRRLSCLDIPREETCTGRERKNSRSRLEDERRQREEEEADEKEEVERKVKEVVGGLDESFGSLSW